MIVALEWPDRPFTWEDIERIQGQAAAAKAADVGADQTLAVDQAITANAGLAGPALPFAKLE